MGKDLLLFARQILAAPAQVSAVAPSSRRLARAMVQGLGPQTGPVVEFGPGTGQITREILATGVAPQDLTLFEMNGEFVRLLAGRFAGVALHRAGAQMAAQVLPAGQTGAVISGLPLLSMPAPVVSAILTAAFTVLRPGGQMRQFTYGPVPPVAPHILQALGLQAEAGRKIWANLPPARVYILRRLGE